MNFQGLQAKYRRLYQESAAWRLLRADNAPIILAFLTELFKDEREVPFGQARVALDTEIERCRVLGIWVTEVNAASYLNQWVRSGWLREMDDLLSQTDACEVALRFSQSLDQRTVGTTASHLRIVQEAVSDFAHALNPRAEERVALLTQKKADIEREIAALNAGVVVQLSEREKRERIREIYQLAALLTGDFRRVEDEIRQLDQSLRVAMIEEGATRGAVLLTLMEQEALLANTDAGSAFEGFFQLLCDENRAMEFRNQLRAILDQPVAEHLTDMQRHFLGQLMRELTRESDRVFHIRRRTEEGLRAYIESGAAAENQAIDRMMSQLERLAIELNQSGASLRHDTGLSLGAGPVRIASPESLRLRHPEEQLNTSGVVVQANTRRANAVMLASLEAVQVKQVALKAREIIRQHGPMSIAALSQHLPITAGIEELVAYLRIAKALGATHLTETETVGVTDKSGVRLQATIPTYLLTGELFPDNMDVLTI